MIFPPGRSEATFKSVQFDNSTDVCAQTVQNRVEPWSYADLVSKNRESTILSSTMFERHPLVQSDCAPPPNGSDTPIGSNRLQSSNNFKQYIHGHSK